ncbi:Fibrinogen-like protein A [Holothuria leucospilota]|uniref:Fibrinogen-like protein A n=1 Tax=Holothuria leucospilota TaxID=206669 RepID=A0A9Q1BW70_HOLLE|nr:Fibrinogen-like protein A [Holothuria leucospilota]
MSQFCHNSKFLTFILYFSWTSRIVLSQILNDHANSKSNVEKIGSSYFFYQQPHYPRDCAEVGNQCSTDYLSGVYLIKPDGYPEPFEVFCDNAADVGGWTVIHRRQDGAVLFNRSWTEHKNGFGFLSQEFWIGNEKLSFLTNQNTYELRIDVTTTDGLSFYATYKKFRISDEYSEYNLTSVGEYNGTEDAINAFLCPPTREDADSFISPDCSSLCSCISGQFSCDYSYECSPNAVCEEGINGSRCNCNTGYKGDGVNCTLDIPPRDCQDVYDRGFNSSGVYKIKPTTWPRDPFDVYCNMSDGGGWTVFQRRVDGTLDFHLFWSDYRDGFGTPDHELWLGNDKLNNLTTQRSYELRIDFVNSLGNPYYVKYDSFSISDESDKYRLSRGTYSGDAGDSLNYNNGYPFTTRDRDNDVWSGINCATLNRNTYSYTYFCGSRCSVNSGWWYHYCGHSFLNSPYGTDCFNWNSLPGNRCNIKYTEMKIRPT